MTTANTADSSDLSPRRHFSSDLLTFSKAHLHYDVNMFFEMAAVQSRLNRNDDFVGALPIINKGLTESFALHLRNLLVFFYNDSPAPLEVVAADFCPEGSWRETRKAITRTLSIAQKRAEKSLLLLTLERQSQEGPQNPWDFDGIAIEIKLIILVFMETAKPERLDPSVAIAVK
jgi:hypothetical protein